MGHPNYYNYSDRPYSRKPRVGTVDPFVSPNSNLIFAPTRESLSSDTDLQQLYAADPVAWVEDVLGEHLWSKQKEILYSVATNRRTAVHTCNKAGKSFTAARAVCWWVENHPIGESVVITSAFTYTQVKNILWKEVNRAHAKGKLRGRTNQTEWYIEGTAGNEEICAFGRRPRDVDPAAFQGTHAKYVLVVFDEACGIPTKLWDDAESLLANEHSHMLVIGNPDDELGKFAECCKPGSGWNVIGIGARQTPNFTGEEVPETLRSTLIGPTWVAEKAKSWGVGSWRYQSRIDGKFPVGVQQGLRIPLQTIIDAQQRTLKPGQPRIIGMDVGAGGDSTTIAYRSAQVVRIVHEDTNPDTMSSCGNLIYKLKATCSIQARVDEVGIGKGVVDRAREQGYEQVVGVNVGRSAADSDHFENLRSEGLWGLRALFMTGNIDIDPDDDELADELVNYVEFIRKSNGKIMAKPKSQMKKSPNKVDAVMLAFIEIPRPKKKARVIKVFD